MRLKGVAYGFIILGIIEALISKYSCTSLCALCDSKQISPCFFLFLFVGIIFVVSGLSILTMKQKKLPRVKIKKVKK